MIIFSIFTIIIFLFLLSQGCSSGLILTLSTKSGRLYSSVVDLYSDKRTYFSFLIYITCGFRKKWWFACCLYSYGQELHKETTINTCPCPSFKKIPFIFFPEIASLVSHLFPQSQTTYKFFPWLSTGFTNKKNNK